MNGVQLFSPIFYANSETLYLGNLMWNENILIKMLKYRYSFIHINEMF